MTSDRGIWDRQVHEEERALLRAIQRDDLHAAADALSRGHSAEGEVNHDLPLRAVRSRPMFDLLLSHGAKADGQTLLKLCSCALDDGTPLVVGWLLEAGAADHSVMTAECVPRLAARGAARRLMILLLAGFSPDGTIPGKYMTSALHYACGEHLERGESSISDWREALTNFHRIDWCLYYESVALLLSAGADVHARDYERRTPLMSAAMRANLDALVQLLDAGADPTMTDWGGQTARRLLPAASCTAVDAVERGLLLLQWAEANAIECTDKDTGEITRRVPFDSDLRDRFRIKEGFDAQVDTLPRM